MNEILLFILSFFIIVGALFILYVILYNNIQAYIIKINEAENKIDDELRKKYDLLTSLISKIVESTDVDKKSFDEFNNIKSNMLSSFAFDRKLTKTNQLINQVTLDHSELSNDESFSECYEEIYKINERLEASKTFYNKYVSLLNSLIKKFPSNLLSKIHKVYPFSYFDGKDLFDDNKEDFKL